MNLRCDAMTTPHRFGRYMLRVATGAALIVLLFPSALFAANLNTLTSVSNAGITITNGATAYRSDFPSETTFWVFNFSWPNSVPNLRANFFLIRGTFGAVDGSPQEGVNYTTNNQSWAAGNNSIGKSFQFVPGGANLPSGTYTALVADTTSIGATMDWFASGGTSGTEPVHYSTITFTYSSSGRVEEIPGALQSVQYGNRVIQAGDVVYRKEILPDLNNPSALWRFVFSWPNIVSNANSRLMIFHGTFGNLVGGLPTEGENYSATSQSWVSGQNTLAKFMSFPVLESAAAPSGTYTVLVAENQPFGTTEGIAEWFGTGGASGTGPRRYSTLTFEYPKYEECCSSVVFLPGIKATELYEGNVKRWLPGLFNFDGPRLVMDVFGQSINNIFVGEPLQNVRFANIRFLEIYGDFFIFLDSLKALNRIVDWKSFPYDWRYDVYDVAAQNQHLNSGAFLNMADEIRALATESDTGKVTIVAHSNGGLVGKALIDRLGPDAALVDRLVMVGTPQLGTPSAIAAMLHGTEQGLPIDALPFAMGKATARELSENMPGAYGLLPLADYFSAILEPVVYFDTFNDTDVFRTAYGDTIDTASELQSFLLGIDDARIKPAPSNTLIPTILNTGLLTKAVATRSALESWTAPEGVEVIQIVGWGLDTPKAVRYYQRCEIAVSGCFMDTRPEITIDGDRTVVARSADALATTADTYYFDLNSFNALYETNWTHANLLAASSTQDLLKDVLLKDIRTAPFIRTTKPEVAEAGKRLRVSVHSPISLGVRDPEGRFTGIMSNPDPDSDIPIVVEEIPNSYYFEFGEGKYIGFNVGTSYDIVMQGNGEGTFTLEIEEIQADAIISSSTYSNVPVSSSTLATLTLQDLASETAIQLDEDGDGVIDMTVTPDGTDPSLIELLTLLKQKIQGLDIKEKLKEKILRQLDTLEKKLEKKKTKNQKNLQKIEKRLSAQEIKGKIQAVDAAALLILIEEIEIYIETSQPDPNILRTLKDTIQSLDINQSLKSGLLRRIARLEKKQAIINSISRLTKQISSQNGKGVIADTDAQVLFNLINQIENEL